MTPSEELSKAEELVKQKSYSEAAKIFIKIRQLHTDLEPYCDYRLAVISNNTGDPLAAYDLYYGAFTASPCLAAFMYGDNDSNSAYVFGGKKDETETTSCPICGSPGIQPKWCYPLTEADGFNGSFNPIRLWMYCEPCHHMVARHFPEKLFLHNDNPRLPNPAYFSYYSAVLDRISRYTSGMRLFEVGIGACECLLAAQEIGFEAYGIDVIDKHVSMARERFGLNADTSDFLEFRSDEKYDIIIMGDVLEHVSDPVAAMQKANDLLCDDGAIWVSTPNFDSAFSITAGHDDVMRRQQYHLNYFSRHSFYLLLAKCGLMPVDYNISSHYRGSMEVISVKSSRKVD